MSEVKKDEAPTHVRFEFIKPEDLEFIYVNGIYGGVTPRGDLLCYLFYEYADIPLEEQFDLLENGGLNNETRKMVLRESRKTNEVLIKRDVKVSLIIPIHQARSFANWIIDKVDKFEKEQKIKGDSE